MAPSLEADIMEKVFGIQGYCAESVEYEGDRVVIRGTRTEEKVACPHCGGATRRYDHTLQDIIIGVDHVEKLCGKGELQALSSVPVCRRVMQLLSEISDGWRIYLRLPQYLEIEIAVVRTQPGGIEPPEVLVSGLILWSFALIHVLDQPVILRHVLLWDGTENRLNVCIDQVVHRSFLFANEKAHWRQWSAA